jgi:hypothetical protein
MRLKPIDSFVKYVPWQTRTKFTLIKALEKLTKYLFVAYHTLG